MPSKDLDPERGRATAAKLRALGVTGVLLAAAEQGYITQLACKMPECLCPEELGGACYFEPVTPELTDWMATHEHYPRSKREGGHHDVDNALLAHRLCNRVDYSRSVGRRPRDTGALTANRHDQMIVVFRSAKQVSKRLCHMRRARSSSSRPRRFVQVA